LTNFFKEKPTDLGDLGWIWPFQIFGCLGVWVKQQIMAGTHWVPDVICFSPKHPKNKNKS
jgi:hypothetical protein